jgi:hypothetical protein
LFLNNNQQYSNCVEHLAVEFLITMAQIP